MLVHGYDHRFLIGSKLEIHGGLARAELKRLSRMLTLALLFVLFALLGAALDHIEQVALLFLQVLLAVGPFLLTGVPALSTLTAALSLTLSAAKPSASTGDWGGSRGCASRGDVGHLH